jgi:hypothetical protein
VYALLAGLLYLGYIQSRTRTMPLARVLLVPIAMVTFSLYGVLSGFGTGALPIAAWAALLLASTAAFAAANLSRGASYAGGRFTVPGSWIPMAVILAIFFARYAINVSLAMDPSLREVLAFAIVASAGYGLASGFFAGRALGLVRRTRNAL